MPRIESDAQQRRRLAAARRLQTGGHFSGHPGVDARIVVAVSQQGRRVAQAVAHLVIAAHREQARKARRVRDRAELLDVRHPVAGGLGANRIEHADLHHRGAEQFGAGRNGAAGEHTARRGPHGRHVFGRGIALAGEILGAGDQVQPGVGLVGHAPRVVPLLAVLAAAAHMGDGVNAAAFEPGHAQRRKRRVYRDAVGPVSVHDGRVAAVEFDIGAVEYGQGHFDPVVGGDAHFAGDKAGHRVEGAAGEQAVVGELPGVGVEAVANAAANPRAFIHAQTAQGRRHRGHVSRAAARRGQTLNSGPGRLAQHPADAVFPGVDVQGIAGRGHALQHPVAGRDHHLCRGDIRFEQRSAQHFEARRALRREQIQRVTGHREVADQIGLAADSTPIYGRRVQGRQRRAKQGEFVVVAVFDFQHGVIGTGGDDDAGKIRLQQRQGIGDAAGGDHRVIGRVRAESVQAHRGLLVHFRIRRVVRQGAAATVVKPRAVQGPLRAVVGGFDTIDGRIQRPARGDFEDVVGGLFRAALRESVDQMPPVPGGLINRQGIVRFALGAQGLRIDQHPRLGAPGALVVELFDIFTGLVAQIEHVAIVQLFDPGGAKRRAAIEFDQALEQGAAIRQRGQNPLGVGRLPSKPGQDLGVGVIFEIPVGVLDLDPPMRLDNVV